MGMNQITDVIREIAIFLILINIISSLVPGESYKKYLKMILGIIIILIVINPLWKIVNGTGLYDMFAKEYKESRIIEMDKSLGSLNNQINDIALKDYEGEFNTPEIEGIAVIAEGGDNPENILKISSVAQALFGVSSHKISVIGMR